MQCFFFCIQFGPSTRRPNCGEPWIECVFESAANGRIELIASPLVKLTNKADAAMESLGTPDQVIGRIGSILTGADFDADESLVASGSSKGPDGRTYYTYELNSPYSKTGNRILASVTTKGEVFLILKLSASDKQWAKAEDTLRKARDTFTA